MNRRQTALAIVALGAAGVPFASLAQKKERVWRVGHVAGVTRSLAKSYEIAFLAGMKDHGYDVGRNLAFDSRYAEGNPARYPAFIDEIIALRPDVLVSGNTSLAIEMKSRAGTIPIVLATSGDAVGSGLAQSLARPGENITGLSLQLHELGAKHIEMMTEILPRMRRVALLMDLSQPKSLSEQYERNANSAAVAKGLALDIHRVNSLEEIRETFRILNAQRVDALLINPSPRFNNWRVEIGRSAEIIRLPSIAFEEGYAQDGGLMSYGPNFVEAYRRAADFVNRIFKGAKPADLPIEQPTKFSLVINAKTAKVLGVTIPQSILLRADRVIE
jgi:ABC-type uncharacterized transport system substrate-binding protein